MPAPRFRLPEEAWIGHERMADGAMVRTLRWVHPSPVARLLLLNGRADFLEKWARTLHDLHACGFSIFSFDWRGQGESSRAVENGAGHIDSFDQWLADLDQLAELALDLPGDVPWLMLGHSMGGHLALRWAADLARAGHAFRREMRGLMLAAPLFDLGLGLPLRLAARHMAQLQVARGNGHGFAWGQGPYGVAQRSPMRQQILTHDREQFEDELSWIDSRPVLAVGGVSWGWLAAFAESRQRLDNYPLEQFTLPTLILLASNERLVDNRATLRIASRLPKTQVEDVPDSAHELLREAEPVRSHVLGRIRDFADRIA